MIDDVYLTKFTRKITWDEDTMKVSDSVTDVWNDAVSNIRDGLDKQMENAVCNHFAIDMSDLRAYMHDKIAWERKQELAIPKWIPVTEQYPEERKAVLVYQQMYKNTYCAFLEGMDWWIYGGYGTKAFGITHWKPLPEPPKEGD